MRTIAFMNLKGGTSKTVSSVNTAAILAREYGERVLLVDADSQGNLTEFVCPDPEDGESYEGLPELLTGKKATAKKTSLHEVEILQANETLMALDVSKAGSGEADPMALADWLDGKRQIYDWVVIDCPPAFSAAAMAALIAADDVIIPMKLDAFGIRGMANLLEQIRNMKRINAALDVAGVLPTMVYPSMRQQQAEESLRARLKPQGIHVFPHIRRSKKVDEMTFDQIPLIYSWPRCVATADYREFVRELVGEDREGGAA